MKTFLYHLSILASAFLLSLFVSNCKTDPKDQVYKGSVFLNNCNTVAIDIDGPTGTGGGIVWQGHQNTATVSNPCLVNNKSLAYGDRFSFKISDTNVEPGSGCPVIMCFAAVPSPGKYIYIYDINKIN